MADTDTYSINGKKFYDHVTAFFAKLPPDATFTPPLDDAYIKTDDVLFPLQETRDYLLCLPAVLRAIQIPTSSSEELAAAEETADHSPEEAAVEAVARVRNDAAVCIRGVAQSVIEAIHVKVVEDCNRVLSMVTPATKNACIWSSRMYALLVEKIFSPLIPLGRENGVTSALALFLGSDKVTDVYVLFREYIWTANVESSSWELIIYMLALTTAAYVGSVARMAASPQDNEMVDHRLMSLHIPRIIAAAVGADTADKEQAYEWPEGDQATNRSLKRDILDLSDAGFAIPDCLTKTVIPKIVEADAALRRDRPEETTKK